MNSHTHSQNMSLSGRSLESKYTHTTGFSNDDGDLSDSDFSDGDLSAAFEGLTERYPMKMKMVQRRITEDDFGSNGKDTLKASVLLGDIFAAENEYEIEWDESPVDTQLSWKVSCNLKKEEGIFCDFNEGFAGWNDGEKVYMRYNSSIFANERCMRIISIDEPNKSNKEKNTHEKAHKAVIDDESSESDSEETIFKHPKGKKSTKEKSTKEKSTKEKSTEEKSTEEKSTEEKSTEEKSTEEKSTEEKSTKEKSTKEKSTKKKSTKKKSTKKKSTKKKSTKKKSTKEKSTKKKSTKKKSTEEKSTEEKSSKEKSSKEKSTKKKSTKEKNDISSSPIAVNALNITEKKMSLSSTSETRETDEKYCTHVFHRGKNNGSMCGKIVTTGDKCNNHRQPSEKKEKIEMFVKGDNKNSDMTNQTHIENITTLLTEEVIKIISGAIKKKYAKKAIKAIQGSDAQENLMQLIKEKMPVKIPTKTVKRKHKSTKKDPSKPKGARSSYIFFCMKTRNEIAAKNPDWTGKAIIKELGRLWKNDLNNQDKQPFITAAAKDRARYDQEMESYTPSAEWLIQVESESDLDGNTKKRKSKKKRNGPKKPTSAYCFFCKDKRAIVKEANPDMTHSEITSKLGRMWSEEYKNDKELSKSYFNDAKKDKERFENEKAEWVPEPSSGAEDEKEIVPRAKSSNKTRLDQRDNEAESEEAESDDDDVSQLTGTHKAKAFAAFTKEHRSVLAKENDDWPPSKVAKELIYIFDQMDIKEQRAYL